MKMSVSPSCPHRSPGRIQVGTFSRGWGGGFLVDQDPLPTPPGPLPNHERSPCPGVFTRTHTHTHTQAWQELMRSTLGYLMQQLRAKSLVKYDEVENDDDNEK